jgi:hypothetical protein
MTYYSALHYAAKAEKSASTAVEAAEIAKQYGNDKINQTHITNCITEIPQDIKLELNDGTLVLKAGSKVYVPNGKNADGSNKFDVVTIASDLTTTDTGNRTLWFTYDMTANKLTAGVSSETGAPVSGTYKMYYDSSENKCFVSYASSYKQTSFPICIIKSSTTGITSIDQVFNGMGYIGSTVFVLPNVKGLIPNGRNADGTLKNIEFTVGKVRTYTNASTRNNAYLALSANDNDSVGRVNDFIITDDISQSDTSRVVYSPTLNKNIISGGTEWKWAIVGQWSTTSSSPFSVTSFQPKLPFRAVDYSEFKNVAKTVESTVNTLPKHVVVTSLPSTKDANTFYYIPE